MQIWTIYEGKKGKTWRKKPIGQFPSHRSLMKVICGLHSRAAKKDRFLVFSTNEAAGLQKMAVQLIGRCEDAPDVLDALIETWVCGSSFKPSACEVRVESPDFPADNATGRLAIFFPGVMVL